MPRKIKRTTTKRKAKVVTGSVVPAKYLDRYVDGSCGDDLAKRLKRHVTADDDTLDVGVLRGAGRSQCRLGGPLFVVEPRPSENGRR